jgi:signal transduction histidine kinase
LLTTGLDPDQRESTEALRASAERLMTQIDHILDFSRLEQNQFKPVSVEFDVRDLAAELIRKAEATVGTKPVKVRGVLADDLPIKIRGDRSALRRALGHLLENAVRFTDRGEVALEIKADTASNETAKLNFIVRDTGRGISQKEQESLFEPFAQLEQTLSRTHEGLGLGLSTAKRLVERLNGQIEVSSELNKGSTFTVSVSLQIVPAPSPTATS